MLLLYTSDSSGTVFVRTDQLDGETDWKVRESIKKTQKMASEGIGNLISESWEVLVEQPSDWIYNFNGRFSHASRAKEGLKLSNTVWANMKLASGEAIGLVIYVGKETRIELNNKDTEAKFSHTDQDVNSITKYLFIILVFLSLVLTVLSGELGHWTGLIFFTRVFIIMSSIIPISMKVNVDFARLFYSWGITTDKGMQGAVARNSNIPEELGRVEYLLSDKTGTLTQNSMKFKMLSSLFKKYKEADFKEMKTLLLEARLAEGVLTASQSRIDETQDIFKKSLNYNSVSLKSADKSMIMRDFRAHLFETMLSFLICNNVTPILDETGRTLQAASPDEVALVKFAEEMGFRLEERKLYSVRISTPSKHEIKYKIIRNFPFSSDRKVPRALIPANGRFGPKLRERQVQVLLEGSRQRHGAQAQQK